MLISVVTVSRVNVAGRSFLHFRARKKLEVGPNGYLGNKVIYSGSRRTYQAFTGRYHTRHCALRAFEQTGAPTRITKIRPSLDSNLVLQDTNPQWSYRRQSITSSSESTQSILIF